MICSTRSKETTSRGTTGAPNLLLAYVHEYGRMKAEHWCCPFTFSSWELQIETEIEVEIEICVVWWWDTRGRVFSFSRIPQSLHHFLPFNVTHSPNTAFSISCPPGSLRQAGDIQARIFPFHPFPTAFAIPLLPSRSSVQVEGHSRLSFARGRTSHDRANVSAPGQRSSLGSLGLPPYRDPLPATGLAFRP